MSGGVLGGPGPAQRESRQVGTTMRRMDEVADRIRGCRSHAQVNPRYRKALRELQATIDIALGRVRERTPYGDPGFDEIQMLEAWYAEPAARGQR